MALQVSHRSAPLCLNCQRSVLNSLLSVVLPSSSHSRALSSISQRSIKRSSNEQQPHVKRLNDARRARCHQSRSLSTTPVRRNEAHNDALREILSEVQDAQSTASRLSEAKNNNADSHDSTHGTDDAPMSNSAINADIAGSGKQDDVSEVANNETAEADEQAAASSSDDLTLDAAIKELEEQDQKEATEESSTDYVPWYLQQEPEIQPAQHVLAGQDMPKMPEHAPAILEPIAEHILSTLGLTFLNILDLRKLTDPPPALGANLLMIVATARSERHLHASADRLCRWLRTEYKLTPFADGLLGRNEMKIAVKRRMRRAKMMTAVGGNPGDQGEIEAGLRSAWICVNVGRVEGGVLPETQLAESQREIIGFGTGTTTSAIVVQMLTEEKREEMDLEGLWSQALKRSIKRSGDAAAGQSDPADVDENVVAKDFEDRLKLRR